jgi:RNA polymerase sigma-70 factor, ECF subfamily
VPHAASIHTPLPLTGIDLVRPAPANDAQLPSIAQLTRRLSAGDEAAFREFHTLYFDRLYHFLLGVTRGQKHAAQDALQETLLRVVRHARQFETEEIFWSWLKAIARNAARDGGRKQRRYLALLERFAVRRLDDASAANGGATDDSKLRSLLDESLGELDPADRRLIEGKYLRGATTLELAAETESTEKAIESRLGRLRRRLAATLMTNLRSSP